MASCTRYKRIRTGAPPPTCHRLALNANSVPLLAHRSFYEDALRAGVIMNPVEMFLVYATELLGFAICQLLRTFIVAIILTPFLSLIRHARREPSVYDVSHCWFMGQGMGKSKFKYLLATGL